MWIEQEYHQFDDNKELILRHSKVGSNHLFSGSNSIFPGNNSNVVSNVVNSFSKQFDNVISCCILPASSENNSFPTEAYIPPCWSIFNLEKTQLLLPIYFHFWDFVVTCTPTQGLRQGSLNSISFQNERIFVHFFSKFHQTDSLIFLTHLHTLPPTYLIYRSLFYTRSPLSSLFIQLGMAATLKK